MPKAAPANFTLYPLLRLAIFFAGGIVAANFLSLDWKIYFTVSLIFSIFAFIFIKHRFALVFVSIAFFAIGGLFLQIEKQFVSESRIKRIYDENRINSGDPIEIEGVLQSKPELAVGGFFLLLKTERAIYKNSEIKMTGNVRLFASASDEKFKDEYERIALDYGSRIRVACNLRREDNYLNAGVMSSKEILDQKGIDATSIIKSPLLVEKIAESDNFTPLAWIYERRQNLIIDFRDNFNVSTAGVLIASLLGNDNFLDRQTAESFRSGGTYHVLVISGLHITFIGGLTLLLIQFFTNQRLWQFLIATAFLWAYSLAVGADVPVVRATIMFTILLFSLIIYRNGTLLNSLGFCALILLVWRPTDIFTSSFQLTFASVGAIVAVGFPLIEKLRLIGNWSPSAEYPFPPNVSKSLKQFCETLYWREDIWERDVSRQLWVANLFKFPRLKWLKARSWQTFAAYVFEAVLISLIFQICLLPLMIVYFHRFPVLSVFFNLWVGIVIALESFAAMFAVFLANISGTLALPIIRLTELLNWMLIAVPNVFTENSWTNLRIPIYSGAMRAIYWLYFVPVIFLTVFLNKWNPFSLILDSKLQIYKFKFPSSPIFRFAAVLLFFLFTLIVFHPFSAPRADGRLHIDFLDVGQGDSALVTFPNGETLLVDGGGKTSFNRLNVGTEDEPEIFEPDTRNIGEAVVSEFLWSKGYSQIDYVLATHADADHIQGLSDVTKNFSVRTAIFGRTPLKNAEFANLYLILQTRGIQSKIVSRGDVLTFDDVKVEVLYPAIDANAEAVSDNNHSLVLHITYGARKILLTGDIERETERELTNTPEFLQSDVIKVAHHGSRTSSVQEFISAAKSEIAIVSVGSKSPFGHPHKEVIERWKNSGANVLTTGENGTISISTDGRDLQLETFKNQIIYR